MSFDSHSELPSHLLALAHLTQWHANTHQLPLDLRFTAHGSTIENISTAVTGSPAAQPPADYTHSATVAAYELANAGHFTGSYSVRINTSPDGQAIIKQIPLAPPAETTSETPAPAPEPETTVSNNGLRLRAALLERGHTSGYSPAEITAEEKERGFTFTPELKFYRALVRNGTVAEAHGQTVIASTPQADFGASTLDTAPWKAPEKTDGTVQAVLNHSLWLEIGHSPTHLYAIDLAPGANGAPGQVIARRKGEASVPVQVALSLADFVTGQFLGQDAAPQQATPGQAGAGQASAQKPSTLAQTIVWAGTVEPIALPGFLGWTLAPTEARYRNVLAHISPEADQAHDEQIASGQLADASSATSAAAASTEPAEPAEASTAAAPAAAETGNPASPTGEQSAGLTTAAQQVIPAPAAPVVIKSTTTQETATSLFASADTGHGQNSLADVDPGVARVPVSPHQKKLASTIGSLAFGSSDAQQPHETKEPAPDTVSSIAARAKKVSLVEEARPEPAPEAPQPTPEEENSGLRSTLRKFFRGN